MLRLNFLWTKVMGTGYCHWSIRCLSFLLIIGTCLAVASLWGILAWRLFLHCGICFHLDLNLLQLKFVPWFSAAHKCSDSGEVYWYIFLQNTDLSSLVFFIPMCWFWQYFLIKTRIHTKTSKQLYFYEYLNFMTSLILPEMRTWNVSPTWMTNICI